MDEFTFYGACVIVMLALTRQGSEDARTIGCVLALCWVLSNAAYTFDVIRAAMATDLIVSCSAYMVWRTNQNGWRTAFLALSVYQLVADAVYDCIPYEFYGQWIRASNAIFTLQLVALGWERGINVGRGAINRILGFRDARGASQEA